MCHKIGRINNRSTSLRNPQKTSISEWVFAILYSWMCTTMTHVGMHENLNTGMWHECVATANKLRIIMTNSNEENVYEKLYGSMPEYIKYLRTFGKMGLV